MATKITSVLTGGSNSHQTSATEINNIATDFIAQGVVGTIGLNTGSGGTGSFAVSAQASPGMSVRVTQGQAYVTGTPTGGTSQTVRVSMDTFEDVTIAANATGGTRYDWIYIKLDPDKMVNPAVDASDVATLTTSRSTSSSTDNGTPPTYGYCLAVVTVSNGASSITNSNITDSRIKTGANNTFADTITATQVNAKSGQHLVLAPGTSKLVKTTVLRQDDTTNTYQSGNTVILTGWGVITPGVTNIATETVTFGVTFTARPIVTLTFGGDAASATTYGSGSTNVKALVVSQASGITTGQFTAYLRTSDGTNWAAGNTVFYQWTAIGEIA